MGNWTSQLLSLIKSYYRHLEWLYGWATSAVTQDRMLRSITPNHHYLKFKLNLCSALEVWCSMPQGLTHSPASSASAPCPSLMISTSFYLGLKQGQVAQVWKELVPILCCCPPFPVRSCKWEGSEALWYLGWRKTLANPFPGRQYHGMSSKQLCGASHPPPTRYGTCSVTEITILWSCSTVMGQGSWHRGIDFPDHCQYSIFLFFTGSHKLCSQV